MIVLSKSQSKCKSGILDALDNKNIRTMTLTGPAGSGKSTLLAETIKDIPDNFTIGLTSPTNKATKVLTQMAFNANVSSKVTCKTIHSVLGLKPVQRGGEEVFIKDKFAKESVFDLLIVDECSMIDDDLIEYIVNSKSAKVMFVGDECQIGPVNYEIGEISRTFTDTDIRYELTEIIRQSKGNPIIELATDIRESQNQSWGWSNFETNVDNNTGNGIYVFDDEIWLNTFLDNIDLNHPDKCRAVAYTNRTVDFINRKARTKLYGEDVGEWMEGETIVANTSTKEYKNSEEIVIKSIEPAFDQEFEVPFWDIDGVSVMEGNRVELRIIQSEYIDKFNYRLSALSRRAVKEKAVWKDFWALKKAFDDFKYIYAMTVHKSQGSSFDFTFVYTPDIMAWGPTLAPKQLLYTAVTRSKNATALANGVGNIFNF